MSSKTYGFPLTGYLPIASLGTRIAGSRACPHTGGPYMPCISGPSLLLDLVILPGAARYPVTIYHLEEGPISGSHRSYCMRGYSWKGRLTNCSLFTASCYPTVRLKARVPSTDTKAHTLYASHIH